MLGKLAQKTLRGWKPSVPRIVIHQNEECQHECSPDSYTNKCSNRSWTKIAFTTSYTRFLDNLPKKDVDILMEDANANIGTDNTGYEDMMGK